MRNVALAAALVMVPAMLQAQTGAQVQVGSSTTVKTHGGTAQAGAHGEAGVQAGTRGQAEARADGRADVSATSSDRQAQPGQPAAEPAAEPAPGSSLSADARAKIDAQVKAAGEQRLPAELILRRVAEGEAKGAGEAAIVAESDRVLASLAASKSVLVRADRGHVSDEEVTRGAQLLARGYAEAQLEQVARSAPSERSLVVAFEVLGALQERGTPVAQAVAQVGARLAGGTNDAGLASLAGLDVAAQAGGAVHGLSGGAAASGAVGGAVKGAANGAAAGAALTGGVNGTLNGAGAAAGAGAGAAANAGAAVGGAGAGAAAGVGTTVRGAAGVLRKP